MHGLNLLPIVLFLFICSVQSVPRTYRNWDGAVDSQNRNAALCDTSDPNPLLCPSSPAANTVAPPVYFVTFGVENPQYTDPVKRWKQFTIEVHRSWAPLGADRFWNLVNIGYFTNSSVYRVLPGFVAQFGIAASAAVAAAWRYQVFPNDPVRQSNVNGTISFGGEYVNHTEVGPVIGCDADSVYCAVNRSTEVYFNYGNNSYLDAKGFAPFGIVTEGFDVVMNFYSGYGEVLDVCRNCSACTPRNCTGPDMELIYQDGIAYVNQFFPFLSRLTTATVIVPDSTPYILVGALAAFFALLLVAILLAILRKCYRNRQTVLERRAIARFTEAELDDI